jgi:hypothetical protein
VPDMRGVVNVVNRGGYVKIFHGAKFRKIILGRQIKESPCRL